MTKPSAKKEKVLTTKKRRKSKVTKSVEMKSKVTLDEKEEEEKKEEKEEEENTLEELNKDEEDEIQEDISDDKVHSKLLKSFGVQDTRRVKERVLAVEPSNKEVAGKATVSDLLRTVRKQSGMKSVEKLLDIGKEITPLDEPLPRFQQEQAEREVNYEKTKREISKWLPLVKRNREAEHMTFPLYHTQATKIREDVATFATKCSKPSSTLEEEIYEVLNAEAHILERPGHFLTEAEEKSLEELTAEEAEMRRNELCKMRALLSYQEEKFRRKNKIKSKKYHKILKKERQRTEEKALSDALKADPNVAATESDKADYLRALERISQKHKVGGRWNKNLLHKKIRNTELKQAMSEQRQMRQQLMEKQVESESETVPEIPGTIPQSQPSEEQFEVDPNNPWLAAGRVISGDTDVIDKASDITVPQTLSVTQTTLETTTSTNTTESNNEEHKERETTEEDEEEEAKTEEEEDGNEEEVGTSEEPKQTKTAIPHTDQEALIDMAFANDDVVAQFVKEKEKIVDQETEKDIDLTLPGWGSWAGIGTSDKPKRRIIQKAKPQAPRRDAKLDHVIINTKKNRKLEQHLVRRLPHPYKSRSVFEREIRQPIGPQWNSVRSFRNMIKPSLTVLDGHVIQPMVAPKGFDNVKIKTKSRRMG